MPPISPPVASPARDLLGWAAGAARLARSATPWRAAGFLLLSLPIGALWFGLLAAMLAVGLALALVQATVVGAFWLLPMLVWALHRRRLVLPPLGRRAWARPVLAVGMLPWVWAARLERRRVATCLGVAIPAPYRPRPAGFPLAKARALSRDPAVWRDLAYLLLLLPIGAVEFVLAAVALVVPIGMLAVPAYYWMVPGGIWVTYPNGSANPIDTYPEAFSFGVVGLGLVLVAAPAMVWAAGAHLALARGLLGPSRTAELEERVDVLTQTRGAAVDAADAERRRIERDLHDGAQQRLVALAMDLGLARQKLANDPDGARALVESSHEEAKRVLAELRDLVRGIHPAVLTDRGLDAAVSALAARSPVPVTVDVRLDARPPEPVETAAYFVVAEALTNAAKHSQAREASVIVRRERDGAASGTGGERLVIDVIDNGLGGADPAQGSGLAGLRDRLAALDGRLTVDSPRGGPTWITAEIPWTPRPPSRRPGANGRYPQPVVPSDAQHPPL